MDRLDKSQARDDRKMEEKGKEKARKDNRDRKKMGRTQD